MKKTIYLPFHPNIFSKRYLINCSYDELIKLSNSKKNPKNYLELTIKQNQIKVSGYKSYLNKFDTYLVIENSNSPIIRIKTEFFALLIQAILITTSFIGALVLIYSFTTSLSLIIAPLGVIMILILFFLSKQHHLEVLFERLVELISKETNREITIEAEEP